jgi:ferric iron reductase protein FhuF
VYALAPVRETLDAMAAQRDTPGLTGLLPGLTRGGHDLVEWVPATALVSGVALPDLLDHAKQRWRAEPHAAAALAWKYYTYWLALPAVLGYAGSRRVPLMVPEAVIVHWSAGQPFLTLGVTDIEVAVLASDPLAAQSTPGVRVVPDDGALLDVLRSSLLDQHLEPIMANIRTLLHVGRRTLLGSIASGVAYGLARAAPVLPGSALDTASEILGALGVEDLVELTPRAGGGLTVQRRTCCLAFTLPEPKICSGCCIR